MEDKWVSEAGRLAGNDGQKAPGAPSFVRHNGNDGQKKPICMTKVLSSNKENYILFTFYLSSVKVFHLQWG
ncbi:hypothetical protein GCM10026983_40000 [Gracilibacillus alcaliphilus]